jgi:hypothetical protein
MEVTEHDIARIPFGNLRVPRDDFAAVWIAAEQLDAEQGACGTTDWYAGGVTVTCRWLAAAVVRPEAGPWRPARSPVTRQTATAYEELIESEYLAAELLDVRRPDLVRSRPGWCEAIQATLRWAWRRSGPPPLPIASAAAGLIADSCCSGQC